MNFLRVLLITSAVFTLNRSALACPDMVKNLVTTHLSGTSLCDLYDRYHHADDELRKKGIGPTARIADLLAPRFINLPDWQIHRKSSNFNPWFVYNPAPATWQGWENGEVLVDQAVDQNISNQ